jgi:hypothetical protein
MDEDLEKYYTPDDSELEAITTWLETLAGERRTPEHPNTLVGSCKRK